MNDTLASLAASIPTEIQNLTERRDYLAAQVEECEQELAKLRRVQNVIEGREDRGEMPDRARRTGLAKRVRAALSAVETFRVTDLAASLGADNNKVGIQVATMAKRGELERVGPGQYRVLREQPALATP